MSEAIGCRTLTVAQAAAVLGISERTAYEACRLGQIPAVRVVGRWVIPREQLERLLAGEWQPAESRSREVEQSRSGPTPLRLRAEG